MAFTTRACKKRLEAMLLNSVLRPLVALVAGVVIAFSSTSSFANPGIESQSIRLTPAVVDEANKNPAWDLQADFRIEMPPRLAELARSTPLYFVLEWRMLRGRWYWLDEKLSTGQLYWRLSHNPLTQQWRMSAATTQASGGDGRFSLTYNSLEEAMGTLRKIRRDQFVPSSELQADKKYDLQLRLRLDTSQLPKPFQLNAITNKDWALDSGRVDHSFTTAAPVSILRPILPAAPK